MIVEMIKVEFFKWHQSIGKMFEVITKMHADCSQKTFFCFFLLVLLFSLF